MVLKVCGFDFQKQKCLNWQLVCEEIDYRDTRVEGYHLCYHSSP